MKKVKKFLLGNIKTVVVFILGLIIGGSVYAATILFQSNIVGYNNAISGLSATNVQDALDELYDKANSCVNINNMGTPTNYINYGSNKPTTSSPTIPPSGKNIYVGLYEDGQYGVCIKRNGTQHCFRYNNWIAESKHVQKVFSDISCTVSSNYTNCDASDFFCGVSSTGNVSGIDYDIHVRCHISADATVLCTSSW